MDHLVRLPPRDLLASLSASILKQGLIKCAFCCESAFGWPGIGSFVRGQCSSPRPIKVLPRVADEPSAFEEGGVGYAIMWGYTFVMVLNSASDSVGICVTRNSDCKRMIGISCSRLVQRSR